MRVFQELYKKLAALNVLRLLQELWMILNIYQECTIGGMLWKYSIYVTLCLCHMMKI